MSSPSDTLIREMPLAGEGVAAPLSIQEVIRRHHDSLLNFLRRRLRVPEDAFDIAQETYIRMLQYESSRVIQSPSAMLYRIAMNVTNDFGRAAVTRQAGSQCNIDDFELQSDQPSPEREVAAGQDLDALIDIIEQLPPKCRHVFLLSRVHHLTYPEIAARCGITVKMVEKHISHALGICLAKVGGKTCNPSSGE